MPDHEDRIRAATECTNFTEQGSIFHRESDDLFQSLSAMALAGSIRNCAAVAVRPAGTHILSLQADRLHRFPASALARILLAPLACAILPASAEDSIRLFNRQYVHRNKLRTTLTFSRLGRNEVAGAIILAIADVIDF